MITSVMLAFVLMLTILLARFATRSTFVLACCRSFRHLGIVSIITGACNSRSNWSNKAASCVRTSFVVTLMLMILLRGAFIRLTRFTARFALGFFRWRFSFLVVVASA